MRHIDIYFLALASFALVTGVALGLLMGVRQDFSLTHVHSHLNLVGWTSLALFGLTYRAYPALGRARLATVQFVASASSGVLFPVGLYFLIAHDRPALAVAAAFVWLFGAILFCVGVARLALAAKTLPSR